MKYLLTLAVGVFNLLSVVSSLVEGEPGYAPDDVWEPRSRQDMARLERLLGELQEEYTTYWPTDTPLNFTLSIPRGRKLSFALHVLLGRTCYEGFGAMSAFKFVNPQSECEVTVSIVTPGGDRKAYTDSPTHVFVPWNPILVTLESDFLVITDDDGHRRTHEHDCWFEAEAEGTATIRRVRIEAGWAVRYCSMFLIMPSYITVNGKKDNWKSPLSSFSSLSESDKGYADARTWIPRLKQYNDGLDFLMDEESPYALKKIWMTPRSPELNLTFSMPKKQPLTFGFIVLEGRTCPDMRKEDARSWLTIRDTNSECSYRLLMLRQEDRIDSHLRKPNDIVATSNPFRMSFEGGFSRTATPSGNFTTIKLPCELRPVSQDTSIVYRLSFEPGWWGRECTMLLVLPSDVRVVPEEANRNTKVDENAKLTRTEL